MIRKFINDSLQNNVLDKNSVAILFSGGMDSLSLLLSCLDIGIKPVLYSFYLNNYESEDIKASRKIASTYNLSLNEIVIDDEDVGQLIEDVKYIIKTFNVYKKTQVQCIYPFLYIIPKIKEKYVLTGLCADDLYGTPRSVAKYYNDFDKFNTIRDNDINDLNSSSYFQIKALVEINNKVLIAPYKQNINLVEYFRQFNYKQMNSPKQKILTYQDYKHEIDKHGLYRRNSNLQCNSKIREFHDKLLNTNLNIKNYKVVFPIYKNLYKELVIEVNMS